MSKLTKKRKGRMVMDDQLDTKIDENAKMKMIFERGIANAQKHNIELEPGRENSELLSQFSIGGNCLCKFVFWSSPARTGQ